MPPVFTHRLFLVMLIGLASTYSSETRAAGTCTQNGAPSVNNYQPMVALRVPADLPVGSAIPGTQTQINWTFTCDPSAITKASSWAIEIPNDKGVSAAVPGVANVYTYPEGTSWPKGIGWRVKDASGAPLAMGTVVNLAGTAYTMGDAIVGQTKFSWAGTIELVKTGPISFTGTQFPLAVRPQVPSQIWGNGTGAITSTFWPRWTVQDGALKTCTVTNPTQTVALPAVSQKALTGAWAVAGATPFSISLKCQKGTKLYIVMTDANNPTSTYNVLFPKDQTLKIVGLKIERADGSRVSFGPDSSAAATSNQWALGDSPDGVLNIPFIASYYTYSPNSDAAFPAGPVKLAATFTLSYQ